MLDDGQGREQNSYRDSSFSPVNGTRPSLEEHRSRKRSRILQEAPTSCPSAKNQGANQGPVGRGASPCSSSKDFPSSPHPLLARDGWLVLPDLRGRILNKEAFCIKSYKFPPCRGADFARKADGVFFFYFQGQRLSLFRAIKGVISAGKPKVAGGDPDWSGFGHDMAIRGNVFVGPIKNC